MKVICAFLMVMAVALCEPPAPNQYLPPGQSGGYNGGAPSSTYGAPGFGGGAGGFGGSAPSQEYGVPGQNGGGTPSSQYGVPGINGGGTPSSSYGAPASRNGFGNGNSFGNGNGFGSRGNGFGSRRPSSSLNGARRPSSSYGVPGITGAIARPSSEYGAPGAQQPNNAYLPPNGNNGGNGGYNYGRNGGNGGYDEGPSEPANYQFEYMVNDPPSGNDFGHMEQRQGDYTQGRYYVVLPDGRKQVVDYEADQNGYRPKISYEEGYAKYNGGGNGANGGYGRGPAGGNGGYSSNGGYATNGGYASNGGFASNGGYQY